MSSGSFGFRLSGLSKERSVTVEQNPLNTVRRTSPRLKQLQSRIRVGVRHVCCGTCIGLLILLVVQAITKSERGFATSDLAVFASVVFVLVLLVLPGSAVGRLRSKLAALVLGILIAAGILETYIRVFDPFPILLRGGRITLPIHAKKQFSLAQIPGLDETISVTFNSFGFRGQEPPSNWDDHLTEIVKRCELAGIRCVLITQPVLYGVGIDELTGVDLETIPVGEVDGWMQWRLLQEYNRVTVSVGEETKVLVIDLANQLPKSSKYFYDLTHYNKEGAKAVAEIIYSGVEPAWQR